MRASNFAQSLTIGSVLFLSLTGCATLEQRRFWIGAGAGAAAASGTAAVLSPNSESRGLNALVFGVAGALAGGALGVLTTPSTEIPKSSYRLQDSKPNHDEIYFQAPAPTELPDFLKSRLKPAVIESYIESDRVEDDGSLHEPHRVYRIKQPSELIARPTASKPGEKK